MSATIGASARGSALPPTRRSLVRPALVVGAALWLYLGFASTWSTGAAVPIAWALLGAYLVPTAVVVESGRRLWLRDRITTVVLLRAMLFGSLLAALTAATFGMSALPAGAPAALRALAPILPAVAEAAAVAAAVRVIGRRTLATPRSGLFLGGALGAGYAAFGSLTAVLQAINALAGTPLPPGMPPATLLEGAVTVQQALLAPIAHPVWGALVGAAVFAGRRALVAAVVGTLAAHILFELVTAVTSGLLGSSAAALVLELLACAAVAAPAALLWRRRSRRLRHHGAGDPDVDQAGGA
ncbi:hypothetical protein [Naasia sp. SYSU D00057]|uniref:hypothetical protein n=1 Tax=Naasia sp. SYSU D00057 TaxID=2817380 RepID=UPI001B3177C2|nr:hypothetical protein [Naasia sp. SYSU D00057]